MVETFQNNLHAERNKSQLTQQELADAAGVSRATVALLEKDHSGERAPRLKTARAIVRVLGCEVDDIWPETDE